MKKSKKWILILMIIIPQIIILTVLLLIGGISIKEFPLWIVIVVPMFILVSPFTFFFAQRHVMYDVPLQKQKKRLLTTFSVCIILFVIILITCYYVNYDFFWVILFIQILPAMLFMFFGNFRLFSKSKKQKLTDDNKLTEKE